MKHKNIYLLSHMPTGKCGCKLIRFTMQSKALEEFKSLFHIIHFSSSFQDSKFSLQKANLGNIRQKKINCLSSVCMKK